MRVSAIDKAKAIEILKKYNKEEFHLRHGLTVGAVMGYLAEKLGYKDEKNYWELVGLMHDVDWEMYPEQHCSKAPSLLAPEGVSEDMINAICSHAYGMHGVEIKPEHDMEKTLFAVDELTGLVGAAALMRPSKSTSDMELKSLKKKFKDKKFAAGCDRDVIIKGAQMMGKDLDEVLAITLEAMQHTENDVEEQLKNI